VLRAVGETETTQENIQDWLQLDGGDPGLASDRRNAAVTLFYLFSSALPTILHFHVLFSTFFFWGYFYYINPDDLTPF
jgi:hypothetical protein